MEADLRTELKLGKGKEKTEVGQCKSESESDVGKDDTEEDSDGYASEKESCVFDSPKTRNASFGSKPSSISPTISSSEADCRAIVLKDPFNTGEMSQSEAHKPSEKSGKRGYSWRNWGRSEVLEEGTSPGCQT